MQKFKPVLTRMFTSVEILIGVRNGIVSRDAIDGKRPGSFDERMRLEQHLSEVEATKK